MRRRARWKPFGRIDSPSPSGDAQHEGRRALVLRPAPVLRKLTLDVADDGCRLLGVDLDELLRGGEWPTLDQLPMSRAREFLDVVLVNADLIDVGEMELDRAEVVVGQVAAFFLLDCILNSRGLLLDTTGLNHHSAFRRIGSRIRAVVRQFSGSG